MWYKTLSLISSVLIALFKCALPPELFCTGFENILSLAVYLGYVMALIWLFFLLLFMRMYRASAIFLYRFQYNLNNNKKKKRSYSFWAAGFCLRSWAWVGVCVEMFFMCQFLPTCYNATYVDLKTAFECDVFESLCKSVQGLMACSCFASIFHSYVLD